MTWILRCDCGQEMKLVGIVDVLNKTPHAAHGKFACACGKKKERPLYELPYQPKDHIPRGYPRGYRP